MLKIMESLEFAMKRKKEEGEVEQEVEGEKGREQHSRAKTHVHGWDEGGKTSARGLSQCEM